MDRKSSKRKHNEDSHVPPTNGTESSSDEKRDRQNEKDKEKALKDALKKFLIKSKAAVLLQRLDSKLIKPQPSTSKSSEITKENTINETPDPIDSPATPVLKNKKGKKSKKNTFVRTPLHLRSRVITFSHKEENDQEEIDICENDNANTNNSINKKKPHKTTNLRKRKIEHTEPAPGSKQNKREKH